MGLRGPAPKPDAIKALEGNPGKRPLRQKPLPTSGAAKSGRTPPKHLLKEAKKAFVALAPMLEAAGVLTDMTETHFAEVCQWYAKYRIATEKMLEGGEDGVVAMQVSESGYESAKPIITLVGQYYDRWEKGIKEYGMTPASWARYQSIAANAETKKDESDPMEALLSG